MYSCMYVCTTACNNHCQGLLLQSMEFFVTIMVTVQSLGGKFTATYVCVQLALLSVPLATVLQWVIITTVFFLATRSYVHNIMVYCDLRGRIKGSARSLNYVLYKPCSMDDNKRTILCIQYSRKCFHVRVRGQAHGSLLHQHHLSWASRKYYPMYCANHQSRDRSYRTGWTAPCSCEGFAEKLLIVDAACLVDSSLRYPCASLARSSTSTSIKCQHLRTQKDQLEQPH